MFSLLAAGSNKSFPLLTFGLVVSFDTHPHLGALLMNTHHHPQDKQTVLTAMQRSEHQQLHLWGTWTSGQSGHQAWGPHASQ